MRLLIVFFFLLCSTLTFADCARNGIYCWPKGDSISANSMIIVEGYNTSQQSVKFLKNRFSAYLISNEEKVQLKLVALNTGEMLVTQAVLKPERQLKIGQTYRLEIRGLTKGEAKLERYNTALDKVTPIQWKVVHEADTEIPIFTVLPKQPEESITLFGCGPEHYMVFNCETNETTPYYVKATVTNLTLEKTSTYFIPVEGNQIKVGHGMCSGPFDLKPGEYKVSFLLWDTAGNEGIIPTDNISFSIPEK